MDATAIRFLVPSSSWRFAWCSRNNSRAQTACLVRDNLSFPGQFAGTCLVPRESKPEVPHDFLLSAFESRGFVVCLLRAVNYSLYLTGSPQKGALCITTIKHQTRTCSIVLRRAPHARKFATAAPTT